MTETVDGGAVPIQGIEFTMVVIGQRGDVIKEDTRVDGGCRFKITEDDQGLFPET